jgi:hypothetical protein
VDFNVSPMVWEVAQIHKGKPRWINEVRLAPASIDEMVREFRNLYPAHPGELWIYGDATGKGRTAQTGKSDYDLMRLAFQGYGAPLVFKVPQANPLVRDRLNAVNRMLRSVDGLPGLEIDPERCPELVRDLEECVLRDDGKDLLKVYDSADPYHERTHASDDVGYFIWREWPVSAEAQRRMLSKPRAPLKYGRMLGDP